MSPRAVALLLLGLTIILPLTAGPIGENGLVLATENDAIFRNDGPAFYMYTNREFEGVRSQPWSGGRFGFSRNEKRTSQGVVFTKFHEGIDIRPVRRNSAGEPLDEVRSIAAGRVVHTSQDSSKSSYGRYVVIEHNWGDGPFFSLYAHLAAISCEPGQKVQPGSPIARLGYSGVGLDRTRAHLHLELNFLIHENFGDWHDDHFNTPNHHGSFNGLNMAGIDIAGFFLAHHEDPTLTITNFIGRMEPYFKVAVPKQGSDLDIANRYPWMLMPGGNPRSPSWEVTFSRSGVPLAIEHSTATSGAAPRITWVKNSPTSHAYHTRFRLTGEGNTAGLSDAGRRYIELVTGRF